MNTLCFEAVRDLFNNGTVWMNGYEMFWYEHAWDVLSRQGMIDYDNDRGYYEAWLRAVSLVRVYNQFSTMVFDEGRFDSDYRDLIDDDVPMIVVGQILGSMIGKDEVYDDEAEALLCVIDTMKYEVFRCLRKEMSESDVFAWMYCTGDDSYFNEETEINNVDDYAKAIDGAMDAIVNDWDVGGSVDAFDYVCRLMR